MNAAKFHEEMGELDSSVLTIQNVTLALARFAHEYELTYDRQINYGNFKKTSKVYSTYRTTDITNKS